jgi:hypothetical protein
MKAVAMGEKPAGLCADMYGGGRVETYDERRF